MADGPRLLPAGTVLRFGSLEFVATGNGYDMDLLPPGANPDTLAPPPRRLSSPTRVEAGVSQPGAVAEDVTASPPPSAATVPPKEGTAALLPFPFGMRTAAATYASSVNTNLSAYEDLPGHHLISIRNLIASPPNESYPDSADKGYVYVRGSEASELDYSGLHDCEAFLSFQAAADYCLTYSDNSSEGDYDPTQGCFMVELAEGQIDDVPTTTETMRRTHRQTQRWYLQHPGQPLRQAWWCSRYN